MGVCEHADQTYFEGCGVNLMERLPKGKLKSEELGLSVGHTVHLNEVREAHTKWSLPFQIVGIRENPSGGSDLITLARSAHAENIDEQIKLCSRAGFEIDTTSSSEKVYFTAPAHVIAGMRD